MVKIIGLSGVHGVGKSTLYQYMIKQGFEYGFDMYAFKEMPFTIPFKAGTREFQKIYEDIMDERKHHILSTLRRGGYDYIILDRVPSDVKVYSYVNGYFGDSFNIEDLVHSVYDEVENSPVDVSVNLCRTIDSVVESLTYRNEKHRENWKDTELNKNYTTKIYDTFYEVWDKLSNMNTNTYFNNIDNTNISLTCERLFDIADSI